MISIIIPTYNEADQIALTIKTIRQHDIDKLVKEIIISDGGSTDDTMAIAKAAGATILHSPKKGRAAQMNFGASIAGMPVLYFLHADSIPPMGFPNDIKLAIEQGYDAGCYRLAFDHKHWFLQANSWFTRFNIDVFRFGDQSLFVTKEKFKEHQGFCEKHIVMEDQHFIKKIKKTSRFIIFKKAVTTSARKYLDNGIYKTQGIFFIIYFMYQVGFSQQKLVSTFRKLMIQDKV